MQRPHLTSLSIRQVCITLLVATSVALAACGSDRRQANVELPLGGADPHSFARPDLARASHLVLDVKVDFNERLLRGRARWTVDAAEAGTVIFDTDRLDVVGVQTGTDSLALVQSGYNWGQRDSLFGRGLQIDVPAGRSYVQIDYHTAPDAAALQWLAPRQTGTSAPFLYSQGQAALTRSWIPIQDSPGSRITYEVTLEVPDSLLAVMSAAGNPRELAPDGRYRFRMDQPVAPYLIALAVGKLAFEPIGERTGVYAIPAMTRFAANELAEVDSMLAVAERLYGDYAWGRYDILVLPASFPFGGMENPRLTFATPTILVGDSSLTSLIAHELAHSWSGNLVTNATWDDFWLNEGITTYIERRIVEATRGRDYAEMLLALGRQDLEAEFADLPPADQHLRLSLAGRDPDDGMTNVAYEKGSLLFQALERTVGREALDNFLEAYFEEFAFKRIDTDAFVAFARERLLAPSGKTFDFEAWIDQPGLPEGEPTAVTPRLLQRVDSVVALFDAGEIFPKALTLGWSSNEWVYFLRGISRDVDSHRYGQLDQVFKLSQTDNAEIAAAWFEAALRNGYGSEILGEIEAFLGRVGRRKFVVPLFRAMEERGLGREAREIYARVYERYHAVTQRSVNELLGV